MGIGSSDPGGYVFNSGGGLTLIRPMETAHPSRPKIIQGATLAESRKRMDAHLSREALRVLVEFVGDDKVKIRSRFRYAAEKPKAGSGAGTGGAKKASVKKPAAKPGGKKGRSGASNSRANALYASGLVAAEPAAAGAAYDDLGDEGLDEEGSIRRDPRDAIERLLDIIPIRKIEKAGRKNPAPPATELYLARCTFENVYALTVAVEIFAIGLVFYCWISLPSVNKKVHVKMQQYVPSVVGITSFSGRLMTIFHAIFYAQYFFSDERDALGGFYELGQRHYADEIRECIASVTPPDLLPAMNALLEVSFAEYISMCDQITPFEMFVTLFSESPAVVSAHEPHEIVQHVLEYIVPITSHVDNDIYTAKARALATVVLSLLRAIVTRDTSDLHLYKNKFVTTCGATVFRYIRERINLLMWSRCASAYEDSKSLAAAMKSTCLLSSFRSHDVRGITNGENGAQATMNLPWETLLKSTVLTRTIAVPGSAYVTQQSRLIQPDQVNNIDIMYTPESADVGKRKEICILGAVTMYRDPKMITEFLRAAVFAGETEISSSYSAGMKLLYLGPIPQCYVSKAFFVLMRSYFRQGGPIRPELEAVYGYKYMGGYMDRNAMSSVETFDIVFAEERDAFLVYTNGGVVGHFAIVVRNGELPIAGRWELSNRELLDNELIAFVTPMEEYTECSSVYKFYATPSITEMPIETPAIAAEIDAEGNVVVPGVAALHTRDPKKIFACNELCPWCWRRGGEARCVSGGCGRVWHAKCLALAKGACVCSGAENLPPVPMTFREDYDYVTIDPSACMGISSGAVPYGNESYGVRVAYQANMGLQSVDSQPGLEFKRELAVKTALEAEPSLCTTQIDARNQRDAHHGVNLMCANLMLPNDNEDATYVSETAVRECLRYNHFKTVTASATSRDKPVLNNSKWYTVNGEFMGMCQSVEQRKFHAIDQATGLPRVGAFVMPGDALYAKYITTQDGSIIDRSEYCTIENYGYIHQVDAKHFNFNATSGKPVVFESKTTISIVLSLTYCYMVGDKVCARYSQKGVIARVVPRRLMGKIVGGPFDGCVPDIINAPTILPTRMTVAIISELKSSKLALLTGKQQNATPFIGCYGLPEEFGTAKNPRMEKVDKELKELGCTHGAMEIMRLPDGTTAPVLFGPIRYLMLRHHAATKTRRAPFNPTRIGGDIFRQSTRGRQGNLRIGCQEAQGYSSLATPYMLDALTKMGPAETRILSCPSCGVFYSLPNVTKCATCNCDLLVVSTVYSLIVFKHILASHGIEARFYTSEK